MAQLRIVTPTGNIQEASEAWTPLYLDTLDGTNGVHIKVPLY